MQELEEEMQKPEIWAKQKKASELGVQIRDIKDNLEFLKKNLSGENKGDIDSELNSFKNKFIEAMAQLGVATNVHYKPLPMMTAYKELGFDIADFPHAYAQFANEVTLPLHTRLTDDEIDYIIESVHKCLN